MELEMISKTKYFSLYDNPNIVIVPTCNENMPPLKRTKTNNDLIENTQIHAKNKTGTVTDGDCKQPMPMQKNVAKDNHLNNNNIPSNNSKHSENQIREEIPKKVNECDSFKITNNYVKEELSQGSCVNNSEGTLTEPIYLIESIDKSSEKFSLTNRIIRKTLQQSEGCMVKHNICTNSPLPDNKIKNVPKPKTSEKFIETDEHSILKENENKQKLECNENKMVKSDEHVGHMNKSSPHFKNETTMNVCNIDKNTIVNHNVHFASKKPNLYRPIKENVDKHKGKAKNRKIIKIVINVTYNNTKTKKVSEHDKNSDLSFLDDFDVDEVVESLFSCKNTKEDINEGILKCDIDNALKNSPPIFTAENIKKEEKQNLKVKAELVKNQSMVCNIYPKEASKDFSYNDNNNITVNEDQNIKTVNITKEKSKKYECSLNEYLRKGLLFQILETKICALFMKKYSIDTVAHCGKFSKIFKCTDTVTGKIYGIKMFNECNPYNGIKEKGILQEINTDIPKENLSCILLIHSFKLDHHWCFVMHYYTINLQQVLHNERMSFHIDEIRNLSMQLVSALIILRSKNIVHSDIKPSHILLNTKLKELKLCGFDEAYYYNDYNCSSPNTGTVNYRAPELILGYSNGYSIDIWSMALVMYEMITNNTLFSGETNYEILYKQISIFGNLPSSMIIESRFSKDYFVGTDLVEKASVDKEKDTINHFKNDTSLKKMIIEDIYEKHWSAYNTKEENLKLNSFCSLLEKMFILDPKHRLPIEYVYANTFFSAK